MGIWFGFMSGDRVRSGDALGTVADPKYDPEADDDVLVDRRCVPVIFDKDAATGTICWIESAGLTAIK